MAAVKDSFVELERHRQRLEENVEKLSQALNHWRQWKEDYETLRQDVRALPSPAGRADLARAREDFEGELLDEKELADIFGRDDAPPRKPEQVVGVLTNRLDYVGKNIDTLQRQLDAARDRLAAVSVVANPDVGTDEDGLPITEIVEELDDDDNVVSYSLRRPGDSQAQLVEALKKAGVADIPVGLGEGDGDNDQEESAAAVAATAGGGDAEGKSGNASAAPLPNQLPESEERDATLMSSKSAGKKKSVAFAEDTKPGKIEQQPQAVSEAARKVEQLMQSARDQEAMVADPVIPADESVDDASLREDMIRYNKETMLYEMAPIVAELQMEEASDIETDEYSDFDDDEEDDDDDEDQWGRSTKPVVDDEWKRQMLELKERLSQHTFGTDAPPDPNTPSNEDSSKAAGIGRISVKPAESTTIAPSATAPPKPSNIRDPSEVSDEKKSVRFAPALDIAGDAAPSASREAQAVQPAAPIVDPLSETVMERTSSVPSQAPKAQRRVSRFKKDRATGVSMGPTFGGMPLASFQSEDNGPRYAPTGPDGQVLADSVLENQPSSSAAAKEPDEFDANLLQQQVAEEYHKARNKFIHRQGGFLKEDENPIQPLSEEEGGPKKLSRFKAARLAKS